MPEAGRSTGSENEMTVTARKPYVGVPRDSLANFHGNQLVYVSWDRHLLFASASIFCVPPQLTFREFVESGVASIVAPDPDAAKIDWHEVEWLKSNEPWVPDFAKSLAANGVGHKDQIRFCTPGLNTLAAETR